MQHLLLLHGAVGSKVQFDPLHESLRQKFILHTMNFRGHGGAEMPALFAIETFAEDVLCYLEANNINSVNIFGYSMGGYVALYLAKHHPEKIIRVFTLATKFHWTPEIAQCETKMLDTAKISEKIPAFAKQLQERHAPNDWIMVMQMTAAMMAGLGNKNPLGTEDYRAIDCPVRISIGDKDTMVTLEETIDVYRDLPNATLMVFPSTQHPIEKVNTTMLLSAITDYFSN